MKGIKRTVGIGIASALAAACTTKLLWTTFIDTGKPLAAIALAVDADNNSYVGGMSQENVDGAGWSSAFAGVLAKHDVSGKKIWQVQIDQANSIAQVLPLNDEYLAVVTLDNGFGLMEPAEPKPSELWLVSASDGALVTQLDSFETLPFLEMAVANGRLYVAKGESVPSCDWSCPEFSYGTEISVYAADGTRLLSREFADRNLRDMHVAADGQLYALMLPGQPSLLKLDAALADVWAVNPNSAQGSAGCYRLKLIAGDTTLFVDCGNGVVQVSPQGEVGNYTGFESYLTQFPLNTEEPEWSQIFSGSDSATGGAVGIVDDNGDLYIAKARQWWFSAFSAEPVKLGGLQINEASVMASDAMLFKVNGQSGAIEWSDDINTPIFAGTEQITSYYYYPLAVHLAGDRVRLTYRGFVGDYGPVYENECGSAFDYSGGINSCLLLNAKARYAKTQDYRRNDGKRLTDVRYDIPYPRAVVQDATGSILVAGDEVREFISSGDELVTIGWFESEWLATEQSRIHLQKSKP